MKKKIITIVIITVALILLFPIPFILKDGGSIEFRALLYTITKYHKLSENPNQMYIDGIGIEILGREIYNSTKDQENSTTHSFFAKVIESNAKYIIVEPVEGSKELKSSDRISIGLGENNDAIYPVGSNVKITYDGMIMESYPAKINVTKIEIKSTEH